MNKKKEDIFGWMFLSAIMLIKICTIFTLYSAHKEMHELEHELHPPSLVKDKKLKDKSRN